MEQKTDAVFSVAELDPQTLFREMPCDCALHELVCDEQGKPVDYKLLDINREFEKIFMRKRESVIGKSAKARLSPVELKYWLEAFAPIALEGKNACLDMFSPQSGKHLSCSIYSPEKYFFVTMFVDVTAEKAAQKKVTRVRGNRTTTNSRDS